MHITPERGPPHNQLFKRQLHAADVEQPFLKVEGGIPRGLSK